MTAPPAVPLIPLMLIAALLGAAPAPACAQDSPLERYIRMGLEANRELTQREIGVRQAEARWEQSRANGLPSLEVEARYSRAEGGRVFDVPVGDLLNPVYSTLNGLTGTEQFPMVDNQRLRLLRDREQDTRVRVTQVLWNPAVRADTRSRRYQVEAARAGTDAARRALVRDIRVSYYRYANATRAETILDAALEMVGENERSSTALWQTSLATRDQVHRARAERLEVEAQRARAGTDRQLAASYLNYLLGRETAAPIELSEDDLALPADGTLGELRRAVATPSEKTEETWMDAFAERAGRERAELRQLDHAVAAAEAGLRAVEWSARPSVALALDAGIQGRDYGFGPDHRYLMGSLVLSWAVWSGGAERSRTREARLERERLEIQREDAAATIRLELEAAALNARVSLATLATDTERVEAAQDAFRLVQRRRDEGTATALEFLDARASLTRAQLARSVSETEALIRLADLDYAIGGAGDRMALPSVDQPEGQR